MDKATIKQKVCKAIAAHRADIEAIANAIFAEPELGFKEVKTAKKVQDALAKLGLEFTATWSHWCQGSHEGAHL